MGYGPKTFPRHPEVLQYLPETIVYQDDESFINFIQKHSEVYIKPNRGDQGIGISSLKPLEEGGYRLKGTLKVGRSRDEKVELNETFQTLEEFLSYFKKHFLFRLHLIQQALDIVVKDQVIDFRVGVNRDQSGEWQTDLFVAKVSHSSNIVSNLVAGGELHHPIDVLRDVYDLTLSEAENFYKVVLRVSKVIAEAISKSGVIYSKFGMDMAIDRNGDIWFIEANMGNPNDGIALRKNIKGQEYAHLRVKKNNMLFMKKLAGFEIGDSDLITAIQQENIDSIQQNNYKVTMIGLINSSRFREELGTITGSYDQLFVESKEKYGRVIQLTTTEFKLKEYLGKIMNVRVNNQKVVFTLSIEQI